MIVENENESCESVRMFLVVEIHCTKMYIYEQNIIYMYLQFSKFQVSENLFCKFLSNRPLLNNYGTAC